MMRKISFFGRKKKEIISSAEIIAEEKSLGQILLQRRLELKIEIIEVANALNAKVRNIEAIENNDFASIDNNSYVFGLVNEYAKFIGINNINEQLRSLNKRSNKFNITEINYESEEEAKRPTNDFLIIASFSLAFLIMISLIYNYSKSSSQEKTIDRIISKNYDKSQ